jgi:hypothetical protein
MKYAFEITEEEKAEYLELIRLGFKPAAAARELDSTGTQFRKFRSPKGQWYDKDFAQGFEAAINSDEHRINRQEVLRDRIDERSEVSDRILEKQAMTELPEWESLRHTNLRIDGELKILAKVAPHFTDEELERAIEKARREELERPDLKALPPPAETA